MTTLRIAVIGIGHMGRMMIQRLLTPQDIFLPKSKI